MLPFRLVSEQWKLDAQSLWQPAEIKLERDVMFPYIQTWMQASANSQNRESLPQSPYNFDIFTLKPSATPCASVWLISATAYASR